MRVRRGKGVIPDMMMSWKCFVEFPLVINPDAVITVLLMQKHTTAYNHKMPNGNKISEDEAIVTGSIVKVPHQ